MSVEADIAALTVATWKLPDHPMAEIERVSIAHQMKPRLLASLRDELGVQGLYYLSTCQRVMLSFLREGETTEAGTEVKGALERVLALGGTAPLPTPTVCVGEEALRHMTYVAPSLDLSRESLRFLANSKMRTTSASSNPFSIPMSTGSCAR